MKTIEQTIKTLEALSIIIKSAQKELAQSPHENIMDYGEKCAGMSQTVDFWIDEAIWMRDREKRKDSPYDGDLYVDGYRP